MGGNLGAVDRAPPAARQPEGRAPFEVGSDLAAVLDDLADVVFHTDAAGNWTYLSLAWERITGFPVASTLGTNFLDYVHPDEREHTIALFMAVVAGGADLCHHQTRYRTTDGGYRWIELRARPRYDADRNLIGNGGTLTDVTARRQAEETVAEHGHVLELATSTAQADELPVGTLEYTPDLTVRRCSPLVTRLLGDAVAVGAPVDRLFDLLAADEPGGRLAGPWGLVATARVTRRAQHATVRLTGPGAPGRRRTFRVSVLPLADAGPDGPALALVLHDVTDLHRAELQQAAVARLGQRALSGIAVSGLLDDAVHVVADVLEVTHCLVLELLPESEGYLTRAAVGWPAGPRGIGYLPATPPLGAVRSAVERAAPVAVSDIRTDPAYDAHPWLGDAVSALAVPVPGDRRRPYGVLVALGSTPRAFAGDEVDFVRAVAHVLGAAIDRRRAEEATRHQTLHDPLTGLANRVLLHDRLDQALRARRRTGDVVALLLMDLDRFKEINDTLGHDVGDEVLRVVADRLVRATRAADTVVRLGGDEFAVVMPGIGSGADAVLVADKLRSRVSELVERDGLPLRVEASVGVVLAPVHGEHPVDLLKRADVAMYRAKYLTSGVAVYAHDVDENRPENLAYFAALREAIAGDQLVLHYQPRVDLRTGSMVSVEALVRWQHPEEGLLGPEAFVPLAERTGLIAPLTWRVLALALDQARRWHDDGWPVPVAVNVSGRVLSGGELLRVVRRELRRADLPPDALELELTESAVMASPAGALTLVTRLCEMGVRLSLDDFGTGYSSLAYLRNLPVHQLKIDRSFVVDVTRNRKDVSIVRSVIDLGHNLDLRVVGEGIETLEAYELLRDLGCDEGQGYYVSRPVAAADLPALLAVTGVG